MHNLVTISTSQQEYQTQNSLNQSSNNIFIQFEIFTWFQAKHNP